MYLLEPENYERGAVVAFRLAIRDDRTTIVEVAKKVGVSRTAITKFLEGRPLSPALLSGLMKVLSPQSALLVLYGHLRDEIGRAGLDPAEFIFFKSKEAAPVLTLLSQQLAHSPDRIQDMVDLSLKWQRLDLEERIRHRIPDRWPLA
jgi:hypothetical protein